VKFVQLSIII